MKKMFNLETIFVMCKEKPFNRQDQKYPDLPDYEFIPLVYPGIKDIYEINKKSEVRNKYTKQLLKQQQDEFGYTTISPQYIEKHKRKAKSIHIIMATIFYNNSEPKIYNIVNHIDHNPRNNNLSNLEWVTKSENNSPDRRLPVHKDKRIKYTAMDKKGNELFTIDSLDSKGYDIRYISSIAKKSQYRYKGYYWKRQESLNNQKFFDLIGFSGNLDDYTWYEHWKYPQWSVCSEGFIKSNRFNKLIGTLNNKGYIIVDSNSTKAHTVIMEYLLRRNLKKGEIIDHINTIKTDNSFSNLRVTDQKGNMNNVNTLEKLSEKIVLADLYGDFLNFGFSRDIQKLVGKDNIKRSRVDRLLSSNVISTKYICIKLGDKEKLHKKMENIIYKFSKDKLRVLGAYNSITSAKKESVISTKSISKNLNSEKPAPDGYYYMRGPEAVKLVLSLGHGTAGDFKLEEKEESQKP